MQRISKRRVPRATGTQRASGRVILHCASLQHVVAQCPARRGVVEAPIHVPSGQSLLVRQSFGVGGGLSKDETAMQIGP
jgi:hypothetical protein